MIAYASYSRHVGTLSTLVVLNCYVLSRETTMKDHIYVEELFKFLKQRIWILEPNEFQTVS